MQTQNGHLTRSASPGLTPPAKLAQIQNGRLFNQDSQIFLRKVYFSYKYQSWQVIQNSINTNLLNLGFLIF